MKFASMIIGAAAASNELFLEPEVLAGQPINFIFCQAFSGYDFFDLNTFDSLHRNKTAKTPARITSGNS